MNSPKLPVTLASLLTVSALSAATVTVNVDGFADPTTFFITQGDQLGLRVNEITPAVGTNQSTHILLEGLSQVEAGTQYYASTYSGIDINSGTIQDTGVVYLTLPVSSNLPSGTVASPIVGVIQRSGEWTNMTFPTTAVGGASGTGNYNGTSIALSLSRDNTDFTGSAGYTVVDADTIELAPFTLSGGISMSGTTLIRQGNRFHGIVTNLTASAPYDSLIFTIELINNPDADFDGVPDISDSTNQIQPLSVGVWNPTTVGDVYGLSATWGYSEFLGYVYIDAPWVYQIHNGWLGVAGIDAPNAGGTPFWMKSVDLGWVYAGSANGGDFFYGSGNGAWSSDNFISPAP